MKVSRELFEEMARVGTVDGLEVVDQDVSDEGNAPVEAVVVAVDESHQIDMVTGEAVEPEALPEVAVDQASDADAGEAGV